MRKSGTRSDAQRRSRGEEGGECVERSGGECVCGEERRRGGGEEERSGGECVCGEERSGGVCVQRRRREEVTPCGLP